VARPRFRRWHPERHVEVIGGKVTIVGLKTERSRRTITLPPSLLPELMQHRKDQAALRLRLGLGKDPADLVFTTSEGKIISRPVCPCISCQQEPGMPGRLSHWIATLTF
jgi:hypothetical protein